MNRTPLLIQEIKQKDNYTFCITWNDGIQQHFRLSEVQKMCCCANCIDEQTGRRLTDPKMINNHVRALYIRSVGRYALRIQFTSGCSNGIYSFDMLRNLS